MRIRQSARFAAQRVTKVLVQKTTIITAGVAVLLAGVIIYQNLLTTPTPSYAITPPDDCFAFSTTTGTIMSYYAYQSANPANPACPKNVDIPSSIEGHPVLVIGPSAFSQDDLTSVTIPEGVTTIGGTAFYQSQFSSITIPSTVTSIGHYAFASGALTTVSIPEGVTNIENNAFYDNQLSSVTLPSTVISIGSNAFMGNQLSSATIPAGLTSIEDGVFSSNQLTEVVLPENITSIGKNAFSYNKLTSLTIPSHVGNIGDYAFAGNQLTSLTIPENVSTIGAGAFRENSLDTIAIPDTVTSLGYSAFEANQLTSVALGCGITGLTDQQFAMNKLQEITIPDCITSVYPTTFFGQNPLGGDIDKVTETNPNWYNSDPQVRKALYDSLWYVRAYTADPSNPNNLIGGIGNEGWYTDDLTGDGDWDDSIGGHLINPATATVRYVDGVSHDITASTFLTGRLANGTNLTDYLVKNIEVPPIADLDSLTPEERTALAASLSQFHHVGQNISLVAPTVAGYTLLNPSSPHIFNLTNKSNIATFTYGMPSPSKPENNSTTGSTLPKSNSKPTVNPTQAIATDEAADTSPTSDKPLTMVDFAAPRGTENNPTEESVPSGLSLLMRKSRLTTDETKSCSKIESAKLLPSTSFTAEAKNAKTLGGLMFTLGCTKLGGDAAITFSMGATVPDPSKIRIYKQNARGVSTDITDLVSITNETIAGSNRTTIRYALQDGKSLDDDSKENGTISDPIYITLSSDDTSTPAPKQTPWRDIAIIAGAIILVTSIAVIIVKHKKRQA